MFIKILILVILSHLVDDFMLQRISNLTSLKQRSWWLKECEKHNVNFSKYKYDYLVCLFIHALEWSIMIMLPILFLTNVSSILILTIVICNALIHAWIDNLKANKYAINLLQDQALHFLQVMITLLLIF